MTRRVQNILINGLNFELLVALGFFVAGTITSVQIRGSANGAPQGFNELRIIGEEFDVYVQIPKEGLTLAELVERFPLPSGKSTIRRLGVEYEPWCTTIELRDGTFLGIPEGGEIWVDPRHELWISAGHD